MPSSTPSTSLTSLKTASGRQNIGALLFGVLRPWLSLALVCAGFSLHSAFREVFWTPSFLATVVQQSATTIVLAVGLTFVIMTGGIDLSVGSVLALSGIALGLTVKSGPPAFLTYIMVLPVGALLAHLLMSRWDRPAVAIGAGLAATAVGGLLVQRLTAGGIQLEGAIVACLAVGCGCGLLNGLLVTLGRVPSFVVTLGMFTAARALTVYTTDGNSVSGLPMRFKALGSGIPLLVIVLVTVCLGAIFLSYTRAGRYIRAIGGNEEAARLSGVPIVPFKTFAYLLSGLGAALGAVLLTSKFMLADTGAATGAELNAIAAVVIGGTSLSGGKGSVLGSLIGALTIQVLTTGLVLVGVKDTLQGVVIGSVIVLAVMLDHVRTK